MDFNAPFLLYLFSSLGIGDFSWTCRVISTKRFGLQAHLNVKTMTCPRGVTVDHICILNLQRRRDSCLLGLTVLYCMRYWQTVSPLQALHTKSVAIEFIIQNVLDKRGPPSILIMSLYVRYIMSTQSCRIVIPSCWTLNRKSIERLFQYFHVL